MIYKYILLKIYIINIWYNIKIIKKKKKKKKKKKNFKKKNKLILNLKIFF